MYSPSAILQMGCYLSSGMNSMMSDTSHSRMVQSALSVWVEM